MRHVSLITMLLLAGCIESTGTDAPPGLPSDLRDASSTALFAALDCIQYHAYFTTPAQPFEPFLPDGFRFAATAAGTFDLRIEVTTCPGESPEHPSTQLWIELPVIPPSDIAVADHAHFLPIEVYVSSEELRSTYENATIAFVQGCHCAATNLADTPLLVDEIVSHSVGGVYELRATMSADSGPFRDEKVARYIADSDSVAVIVLEETTVAQNRGAGAVQFQYSGPGGAPPIHGGIIHSVVGTTVRLDILAPGVQQSL